MNDLTSTPSQSLDQSEDNNKKDASIPVTNTEDLGVSYAVIDQHTQQLEDYKQHILQLLRPHSKLGLHRGENRVIKSPITEQQKGQSQFDINGVLVWAGSHKAAIKKARKLQLINSSNDDIN